MQKLFNVFARLFHGKFKSKGMEAFKKQFEPDKVLLVGNSGGAVAGIPVNFSRTTFLVLEKKGN
jgi:hypothetical protein